MINSIVSFKKIPIKTISDIKIPNDYTLPVKNNGDIFIYNDSDYEDDVFITNIDNDNFKNIASTKITVNKKDKTIFTDSMDVWQKNDRQKGLGTIMHLNNIIELLENNFNKIELDSLADAVVFHTKHKFKPDIYDRNTTEDILYQISLKDTKHMPEIKDVVKKASNHLSEMEESGYINCLEPAKLQKTNEIISEYLKIVTGKKLNEDEKKMYNLQSGLRMTLKKEEILKEKDFFNNLFEKSKIDYRI